jgi:peptidoglycan/LPS O-acetylase OafA/YrhL
MGDEVPFVSWAVVSGASSSERSEVAAGASAKVAGLDGARAIATLSVFFFHASWRTPALGPLSRLFGHADIGVEIFFILSGFLVARPLVAHAAAGRPPVRLVDFWRRRVARIWPAYLLALVGAVLLGIGTVDGVSGWLKQGFLVDSWFANPGGTGLRLSWTLVVEVSFYVLVVPLAALAVLKRRPRLDAWVGLCLAMVAIGGLAIVVTSLGPTPAPLRVLPPFLPTFAVGMLLVAAEADGPYATWLGAVPRGIQRLAAHPRLCGALGVATFITMAVVLRPSTTAPAFGPGPERMAQSFGQILVGFLLLAPLALGTARHRWLEHRWLLALAAASYGFYLWHLQVLRLLRPVLQGPPIVAVVGIGLALAGAFVAGEVSRRFIEQPARRRLTR